MFIFVCDVFATLLDLVNSVIVELYQRYLILKKIVNLFGQSDESFVFSVFVNNTTSLVPFPSTLLRDIDIRPAGL